MDAATTTRLATLDNLRRQRSTINRAIAAVSREIRERRDLIDALEASREALTARHNAVRSELVGASAPADPAAAEDLARAERMAPPAIVERGTSPAIVLYVPGREPLCVAVPAGHEARAEAMMLGFMLLFPTPRPHN